MARRVGTGSPHPWPRWPRQAEGSHQVPSLDPDGKMNIPPGRNPVGSSLMPDRHVAVTTGHLVRPLPSAYVGALCLRRIDAVSATPGSATAVSPLPRPARPPRAGGGRRRRWRAARWRPCSTPAPAIRRRRARAHRRTRRTWWPPAASTTWPARSTRRGWTTPGSWWPPPTIARSTPRSPTPRPSARIWANVVDDAALSTVQVPARVERGPLQVAISSGGGAPMLARHLREQLEAELDEALVRAGAPAGPLPPR